MHRWLLKRIVNLFFNDNQALSFPKAGQISPTHNEPFGFGSFPFVFNIEVTFFAQSGPVVMAKPAFKRFDAGSIQFA